MQEIYSKAASIFSEPVLYILKGLYFTYAVDLKANVVLTNMSVVCDVSNVLNGYFFQVGIARPKLWQPQPVPIQNQ